MRNLIFLLFITPFFCSEYTVDPTTLGFLDGFGRNVLFHGMNVIYKTFPFYPEFQTFDPALSLCDQDFIQLKEWGFNFVRLLISWQGAEIAPGVFNTTYIETVREIVRMAADYNITILLDMHQDLLSEKFCGDGFPMWALNITNFPAPLNFEVSYDSSDMPNQEDCFKAAQFQFYLTENVQGQWKEFYNGTNVDLQEHMANFWGVVASYFKDEPNVLGYEIINEPFSADLYGQPWSLIKPQVEDYKYLQPLYAKVNQAIRQYDNDTIVFFEPIVDDVYAVDLTEGPGGPGYNNKQALSYHIYCWTVNGTGAPSSQLECDLQLKLFFDCRIKAAQRIGVPGFLTEFGGCDNSTASFEEMSYITTMADNYLQSWAFWSYKNIGNTGNTTVGIYDVDGQIQTMKLKSLSRSYFYATCGNPQAINFQSNTGKFVYTWEPSPNCQGKNSEFFLSESMYYPNGFDAVFSGCSTCSVQSLGMVNYYEVILGTGYSNQVTITITPKAATEEEAILI